MDNKLCDLCHCVCAYIDDIVIFSNMLKDHINHLDQVFGCFTCLQISLNPVKSFVGFPNIHLLGQCVDFLELTTVEDKIRAITALFFSENLQTLKTYLDMTG